MSFTTIGFALVSVLVFAILYFGTRWPLALLNTVLQFTFKYFTRTIGSALAWIVVCALANNYSMPWVSNGSRADTLTILLFVLLMFITILSLGVDVYIMTTSKKDKPEKWKQKYL